MSYNIRKIREDEYVFLNDFLYEAIFLLEGEKYMAVKMLHTCIRVKNLEESLKFYKEALGLVETRRKDFKRKKHSIIKNNPKQQAK